MRTHTAHQPQPVAVPVHAVDADQVVEALRAGQVGNHDFRSRPARFHAQHARRVPVIDGTELGLAGQVAAETRFGDPQRAAIVIKDGARTVQPIGDHAIILRSGGNSQCEQTH